MTWKDILKEENKFTNATKEQKLSALNYRIRKLEEEEEERRMEDFDAESYYIDYFKDMEKNQIETSKNEGIEPEFFDKDTQERILEYYRQERELQFLQQQFVEDLKSLRDYISEFTR